MGSPRILSREACSALAKHVMHVAQGGGNTTVEIQSEWTGDIRWARNRTTVAGDRCATTVRITRAAHGAIASVNTNQTSPDELVVAVRAAEWLAHRGRTSPDIVPDPPAPHTYAKPVIWSESTFQQSAPERSAIAQAAMHTADQAKMMSYGYLNVSASGHAWIDTMGRDVYYPVTQAQYSLTMRDLQGTGSGWAGASAYDWARFDPDVLVKTALKKCLASRNPVAIEPGRYTTILEPQAVFQLLIQGLLVPEAMAFGRPGAEWPHNDGNPFYKNDIQVAVDGVVQTLGNSKLGDRLLDKRLTIRSDPMDPDLAIAPLFNPDNPYRVVTWFDHGILKTLPDDRLYALRTRHENEGYPNSRTFRVSVEGATTSMDEMISSTQRGLLVTRFTGGSLVHAASGMRGGVTRDGLWLIENGNITKAIKNLRYTESPLFAFNNVEQLGVPVPIFSPGVPSVVPPIKVKDFSFTSLSDAI